MKTTFVAASIAALAATPILAQGNVEDGESAFRKCQTCHVVVDESGETLAGRNAKTGPNLYGVAGRTAGTMEDFGGYSDIIVAAGEQGLTWTEEDFVAYVQDPTAYLREYTGDSSGRGAMAFKVRDEQEAADLYAYLESLGGPES